MNARDTFSELRSRLQQRPNLRVRAEVFGLFDRFWEEADDGERARFVDEHVPYVLGHLEDDWPDELRVWTLGHDGAGSLQIARTMRIVHPVVSRHAEIDPEVLDRVFALTPDDVAHLDGVRLEGSGRVHARTNAHVLEVFGPLTRVEVFTDEQAEDLFDELLTCHATTATRLGVARFGRDYGSTSADAVAQVCGRLLERLGDLSRLEGLTVSHTIGREPDARAWLPELLAHPAARALDTLSFHVDDAKFDPSWLTDWEGVGGLKRLHVFGLQDDQREALVTAPALGGVARWNLSSSHFDAFLDDESDAWTALARGEDPGDVLATRKLELPSMCGPWIDRLFLDAHGDLRGSTRLEDLHVGWPTLGLIDALLVEGTEAFPNLERLELETQALETTEYYAAIGASGLLDQLDAFDWLEKSVPYPFSTPEQRLEDIATWGAIASSPDVHVSLRRRTWVKLLNGCGYTLTHLRHLGRTVGLRGRSKMDAEELRAAFEAMIPPEGARP